MSKSAFSEYPRRVVVDDTDNSVKYSSSPGWSLDVGGFDTKGAGGPPLNRTMHGTNAAGSSFEFTFEGDYVLVRGARDSRNQRAEDRATWSCNVDGMQITSYKLEDEHQVTNLVLCEMGQLSRASHKLTVNVTDSQWFWVDAIEYHPLEEKNGGLMRVENRDSGVVYGAGEWKDLSSYHGTRSPGATVSFKFNGTSVSLYMLNQGSDDALSPSRAHYRIDSGLDTSFTIPGSQRGSDEDESLSNQLAFSSPTLDAKQHEVVVVFDGPQDTSRNTFQGLNVDYFIVTASSESRLASPTQPDGPPATPSPSPGPHKPRTSVVAGAVIGTILALLFLAMFVYLYVQKRREKRILARDEVNAQGLPVDHDFAAVALNGGEKGQRLSVVNKSLPPPSPSETPSRRESFSTLTNPYSDGYKVPATNLVASGFRPSTGTAAFPPEKQTIVLTPPGHRSSADTQPVASPSNIPLDSKQSRFVSNPSDDEPIHHQDSGMRFRDDVPPNYTRE